MTLGDVRNVLKKMNDDNSESAKIRKDCARIFLENELDKYGLDLYRSGRDEFKTYMIDIKVLNSTLNELKRRFLVSRKSIFTASYFITFFLAGLFDLNHSTRKIKKTSEYYTKNAGNIMKGSKHKTSAINLFKQGFTDYKNMQIDASVTIPNYLLNVRIIHEMDKYILQAIGLITENDSSELFERLRDAFKNEELFMVIANRKADLKEDGVRLLVACILSSLEFDNEDVVRWIYEKGNAYEYNVQALFNKDTTFFSTFLEQNSLFSANGALELAYRGKNFLEADKENTENIRKPDSMELLILADIYFYKSVNMSKENYHNDFFRCSMEAFNQGNRGLAAYNVGYYYYMAYFERVRVQNTSKNDRLKKAIEYFIIAGKSSYPPAFTSLGNIAGLLNESKTKEKNKLKEFAIQLGGNIEDDDPFKLQCFYYKLASKNNNIDGSYNYIRTLEKRAIQGEKIDFSEFCELLVKLVNYNHPKGVNLFCQYILYRLHSRMVDINDIYEEYPELMPASGNTSVIGNLSDILDYNFRTKKRLTSNKETLTAILNMLNYSCCYVHKLLYFWPVYTYCALKYHLRGKEYSSDYDSHKIHELLISILNPGILSKEGFTFENEQVKYIFILLIRNLTYCGTSSDIYSFKFSKLYKKIKSLSKKADSELDDQLRDEISEFDTLTTENGRNSESADYEYINTLHNKIQGLMEERNKLKSENKRINEENASLKKQLLELKELQ